MPDTAQELIPAEELLQLLRLVELEHLITMKVDEASTRWADKLSLGETQRSVIRALTDAVSWYEPVWCAKGWPWLGFSGTNQNLQFLTNAHR